MKKDDSLWKGLLEDLFDDLLLFIFKEEASILDLEKGFEFLNNELAQIFPVEADAEHPKYVDKLVKVFTQEGEEEWILVHVEVQGYDDKAFAERMFTYFYRILDKYRRKVTCLAILTGNSSRNIQKQYSYKFLGTENHFTYNVYNIAGQNREELSNNNNVFALVVLAVLNTLEKGKFSDTEMLGMQTEIAKMLLRKSVPKNKIRAVMYFLRYYVHLDNPENVAKFDTEIAFLYKNSVMGIEELLNERAEMRGIVKGKEQGAAETKTIFVKSLLLNTDFDASKIAFLAGVEVYFVEQVKLELGK